MLRFKDGCMVLEGFSFLPLGLEVHLQLHFHTNVWCRYSNLSTSIGTVATALIFFPLLLNLDTSDVQAVNATVVGESTIDIQCWFIHGSDVLGCRWYWSVTTPMLVMYIQTFQGVTCQPLDNSV